MVQKKKKPEPYSLTKVTYGAVNLNWLLLEYKKQGQTKQRCFAVMKPEDRAVDTKLSITFEKALFDELSAVLPDPETIGGAMRKPAAMAMQRAVVQIDPIGVKNAECDWEIYQTRDRRLQRKLYDFMGAMTLRKGDDSDQFYLVEVVNTISDAWEKPADASSGTKLRYG